MEPIKNTSVYLEESQRRYLKIISMINGLNTSQYIRTLIDDDMEQNSELYKKLGFIP